MWGRVYGREPGVRGCLGGWHLGLVLGASLSLACWRGHTVVASLPLLQASAFCLSLPIRTGAHGALEPGPELSGELRASLSRAHGVGGPWRPWEWPLRVRTANASNPRAFRVSPAKCPMASLPSVTKCSLVAF